MQINKVKEELQRISNVERKFAFRTRSEFSGGVAQFGLNVLAMVVLL